MFLCVENFDINKDCAPQASRARALCSIAFLSTLRTPSPKSFPIVCQELPRAPPRAPQEHPSSLQAASKQPPTVAFLQASFQEPPLPRGCQESYREDPARFLLAPVFERGRRKTQQHIDFCRESILLAGAGGRPRPTPRQIKFRDFSSSIHLNLVFASLMFVTVSN